MKLLGSRPINWFDANLISEVEPQYLGCDRPVYAAQRQLTGLLAYFARHFGDELWVKLWVDDGRDATSSRLPISSPQSWISMQHSSWKTFGTFIRSAH